MRNPLQDAQDLLTQDSAEFLRFLVEEAAPVQLNEADEKIVEALGGWYDTEQELKARLCTLIRELGGTPNILQHPLELGYYNFARPRIVVDKLVEVCAADTTFLEGLHQDYTGCEDLRERQLLSLTNDYLAQRRTICEVLEQLTGP
jgi:hypothetical protein